MKQLVTLFFIFLSILTIEVYASENKELKKISKLYEKGKYKESLEKAENFFLDETNDEIDRINAYYYKILNLDKTGNQNAALSQSVQLICAIENLKAVLLQKAFTTVNGMTKMEEPLVFLETTLKSLNQKVIESGTVYNKDNTIQCAGICFTKPDTFNISQEKGFFATKAQKARIIIPEPLIELYKSEATKIENNITIEVKSSLLGKAVKIEELYKELKKSLESKEDMFILENTYTPRFKNSVKLVNSTLEQEGEKYYLSYAKILKEGIIVNLYLTCPFEEKERSKELFNEVIRSLRFLDEM